ncbi:TGBp1 [Turtle grass virus X]|uniref:TGBp1 n=1 Tax=Turtle grass virus X TaxID=2292642 RepID=A0A345X1J6_9VIRU|nr:TGBp1 [Turtle grass virus X]AXK15642.1 TGBp1 [Turtle grass virus X]
MDLELTRRLLASGYTRTEHPRAPGAPIVVHAVAGAGKTTFLRSLLEFRETEVYTAGTHDPPSLTGKHIRCAQPPTPGAFNILDEYPAWPTYTSEHWQALFADNLQHSGPTLRAHYTCSLTYRFGEQTAEALRHIGFTITPRPDSNPCAGLSWDNLYVGYIFGQVITLDQEAHRLATAHGLSPITAEESRGLEFDTTTVVTTQPTLSSLPERHLVYVALTRHRKQCHLRTSAIATTPGQH